MNTYRMDTVKILAADVERITHQLELAIADAHANGASWAELGTALGLSKQTAHNRYGKLQPKNEVQQHHAEAAKFLDGQSPAKPEGTRITGITVGPPHVAEWPEDVRRKPSKKQDTAAPAKDERPSFTLHSAGMKDGVAQPGTGKGPHACPRCGSTNHKSAKPHTFNAYPGECKPTKYDPADIADVMTNYLKTSK